MGAREGNHNLDLPYLLPAVRAPSPLVHPTGHLKAQDSEAVHAAGPSGEGEDAQHIYVAFKGDGTGENKTSIVDS